MADLDINAPQKDRRSKIQIEEQQDPHVASPAFANRHVVYPNKLELRPYRHATVFEIVIGAIFLLFGILLVGRLFFVPDNEKTRADIIGLYLFYTFLGIGLLVGAAILISRALKFIQESSIYILPNGFPISFRTIRNDYDTAHSALFEKMGYYDVEGARASNPIVAPGEITSQYAPQFTYAPSNMPGGGNEEEEEEDEEESREELLDRLLLKSQELPEMVDFFDHIDAREPGHLIIGVKGDGELLQLPILRMLNHLVAGAVGTGKSVYLRSLVFQLIQEADNSDIPLEIGLADIENNTFPEFRECRHVRWYASNYVEIEHMTNSLLREVERRKGLYESLRSTPKDIERYNTLARRDGVEELPIVVVVYDEFSALMHRSQAQQKRILSDLLQLALRARKYGIFLVIAGQTFKADLVDSAVLGQFNFSIAFKVRSLATSMSILGQPGAEKLTHPGEALIKAKDGTISAVQTLMLDDDVLLDALTEYRDGTKEQVPEIVREIINFCHAQLEDKVLIKEVEGYLRQKGITRSDVLQNLTWMDQRGYTLRTDRNARILNWTKIESDL